MAKNVAFDKPVLVGTADFANGVCFKIEQTAPKSYRITDLNTGAFSHSGSASKAWSSVRYQAQVRQDTENTHGWKP